MSSAAATSFSPSSFGTSQPGTVSGSEVVAIVPSSETRIAVSGSMLSICLASARKASTRPSSRAVGAGRVLPDDEHFLAGIAPELALGQVACRLRLGSGRVVVRFVLAGQRGAEADNHGRSTRRRSSS
ncbi:MAG TPA: hypothetical protein VF729_02770 [Solirubrobacterales bacterium]